MTGSVAVVGGGVAGLAAAYRLLRADPSLQVTVLEAAPDVGGRLRSVKVADLELEAGPDSFVARKPWAVELCRELGLDLVAPNAEGAFVWTELGLERLPPTALGVPAGGRAVARWPGLSRRGRARALLDLVRRPRRVEGDRALGAVLRRRLGDEATDALTAPLLAGLFAGDVDRLGVASTFPELATWERDVGSLLRGAGAALGAARDAGSMFLRPAAGVPALPAALADALGPETIRTSTEAAAVARDGSGFVVRNVDGREVVAASVVLATPAFVAARLIADLEPAAAAELEAIRYVSTAVALLVYPEGTAQALPDASGFVVPSGRAPMTAATFLSRKWPHPAFGDRAVLRCFVGADGVEDVLDAADEEIIEAVARHLAALLPLAERLEAFAVVRWPRSMPQYEVGHLDRVARIEAAL
ncbi:MAG TPA: protoporphyrinogen oxidase, partial [Actinomycetota bacterium]|nr:protoporphyrinogen oxidase [Actinomycetota bacterium]